MTSTVAAGCQRSRPPAQGAEDALIGGSGGPGADGSWATIGGGRRGLEWSGTVAGVKQRPEKLVGEEGLTGS